MGRILKYQATASDTGRAVREILRDEFCLVAHDIARAKYRTEKGITVNGVSVKTDRVLREGDVVEFLLLGEPSLRTVPVRGEIRILYEDEDLICLDKPAGLVVHPSHGHFADSLGNYLASYFEEKGEPHEIRTVGRLDKDTSGVICFGKSRTACALMMGQGTSSYRPAPSRKQYLALSRGRFPQTCGTVDAPISREYEEKIYSRKLLKLPAPRYYVFYNGTDRISEREDLRLSTAYGGEGDLEVIAHMINVNVGYNDELLSRCRPMHDYSELIHRLRTNLEQGMTKEEAVEKTVDSCIEDDILADILRKERAKVMSRLFKGLTEEQKERMYAYEKECEREEGREEGRMEAVYKVVAEGAYTEERACEVLGVDIDRYREYISSSKQEDSNGARPR